MRKGFFARLALSGIRKNRKIYYPYLLTAILTAAMMYIIGSLQSSAAFDSEMLGFSLQLGTIVTSIFSVVFLFYTNSFLMKQRKKEFGLYNVLGMEKKHLARVLLWETVILLVISLVIGLAGGILLDKLLHMALERLIGQRATLSFSISIGSIVYTFCLVGATFLLILLNSIRQVYTAKPVELLRSGEVGEKEPKTKWLLTLLGVLTLGAGYYLAVTIKDPAVMLAFFFAAVLLVIAGTYLLFTAGSITLIKALRKNKRFYYKPDHFISVSGMLYRMKQNAIGLGNVCILSTMVLVMVFSTVSLWFGMEDIVNVRCRSDIQFESSATDLDALFQTVDEVLDEHGLSRENDLAYHYLSFAGLRRDDRFLVGREADGDMSLLTDAPSNIYVIPLEDYNRAFGQDFTLMPGELLVGSNRTAYTNDSLTVLGETFRVLPFEDEKLKRGYIMANIYDSYFLIVDSMDTLLMLDQRQADEYGRNASYIRSSFSFDISGTADQETAFANALRSRLKENGLGMTTFESREVLRLEERQLFGGLLFVGLFLSALFLMAMVLIIYYKQISEGYDDRNRYRIMRKVGLSRAEIKRSISSQILIVFFLPLLTAGLHIIFAFPALTNMFKAFSMTNMTLMALCALGSFLVFGLIYGAVYILTAKVYYRIVSE